MSSCKVLSSLVFSKGAREVQRHEVTLRSRCRKLQPYFADVGPMLGIAESQRLHGN